MSQDVGMTVTEFAESADGTRIAFERTGSGPLLVLVDGAMCSRSFGPARPLAAALADRYTVVAYDRRGRGESGETAPYSPEREFEDLAAVIAAAGGDAIVLGQSSGAALAYRAAAAGVPMRHLIGYEAPWVGRRTGKDGTRLDYHRDLERMIAAGENGRAVGYFMVDMVGAPRYLPFLMRLARRTWRQLVAVAPTLPYDAAVLGPEFEVPTAELAAIRVPVVAVAGSRGAREMLAAQRAIADAIPGAQHRILDGQTHQVTPAALRSVVLDADRREAGRG